MSETISGNPNSAPNGVPPVALILCGVSGSGKSEVGRKVAGNFGIEFLDGDDFHSVANKEKMHHGIPLTDEDRKDWLRSLHEKLGQELAAGRSCVLACSALKKIYRTQLHAGLPGVHFIYLKIDHAVVAERLEQRKDHFFDRHLLDSQFATLEEPGPDEAVTVDQNRPLPVVVQDVAEIATTLGLEPK